MAAALPLRRAAAVAPAAAPTATAEAVLLDAAAAAAILPQWRALAAGAAEPNPFFHPDMLLPALARLPGGRRVRIAAVQARDGRLIALAPVRPARLGGIAPALAVWVHDYGPLGVPLADPAALPEAMAALVALAGGRPLALPFLPLAGPVAAALRAGWPVALRHAHQRAALAAADGDPRAALERRRRKEYARQLRRLGEGAALAVDTAAAPDAVMAALDEFLALEAAGWKGRAGTALARRPEAAAFARETVRRHAAAGTCRIAALRRDGAPAAMLVSFLAGDAAFTWKIAHDERLARFSPGAQLMLEAAPALFGEGVSRIDSLAAPGHPMIDHLWSGRLALGTLVVAPRPTPLLAAGLAVEDRLAALKAAARRVLKRRRSS